MEYNKKKLKKLYCPKNQIWTRYSVHENVDDLNDYATFYW